MGLGATVAVPVWILAILVAVTAWWLLDRLLMPSARWLIRRRVDAVLDEINQRLNIKIQPFRLTRRQALVDLLTYDSKVVEAAQAHAVETGQPREVVMAEVRAYAEEIVPAFNAYVYFRIGYWLARRVARALYRVRIGSVDAEGLKGIPQDATVVFVMNHRSNMDYVLVAFLAAEQAALSYAVGEWARVWPLQALIRAMGAYFIRRDSKSPLYRRVLERYVRLATDNGVAQAVFPEGGLSRDGSLRAPKMGLLDYMLRGFDAKGERDIVFVPVAINYDRVLEDRTLLLSADPEAPRRRAGFVVRTTLGFWVGQARLAMQGRWSRFGYACVNFGTPVGVRDWAAARGVDFRALPADQRHAKVQELAVDLMARIGGIIPVLPVPLIARVLLEAEGPLSALEIKARVARLIDRLEASGARVQIPRRTRDHALEQGIRQLVTRRLAASDAVGDEGLIAAADRRVLAYYANSLSHLDAGPAPVSAPADTLA